MVGRKLVTGEFQIREIGMILHYNSRWKEIEEFCKSKRVLGKKS